MAKAIAYIKNGILNGIPSNILQYNYFLIRWLLALLGPILLGTTFIFGT